jgi:rhodanese-related sulfurtransferase
MKLLTTLLTTISCMFFASCWNSPKKPIPALDLSKAIKQEKPQLTAKKKIGQITRMPVGNLYQLVEAKAALIYDVRPAIFFKLGHIDGAINWPKSALQRDLAKHEPALTAATKANKPVVLYCTDFSCPDATTVATSLAARGHDVSVLQGGYEAWKLTIE